MSTKILELLEPTAVRLQIEAIDSADVIAQLGSLLMEAGFVRDTFISAALERESQLPTGLPLGGKYNAAIPHTDVEHVIKPGLAMATLVKPISFQNMVQPDESVPVQLVFFMALDQPKAQVEMLQEIAMVLQDAQVIEELMNARDFADVNRILTAT